MVGLIFYPETERLTIPAMRSLHLLIIQVLIGGALRFPLKTFPLLS